MNGILLLDKPSDWTSNDVVAKLKGVLHERRIGHSGTLDPMATGLLVVFVGRATRAVEFAEADSKRYIAGLRLGISTDTQDTTGAVLRSADTYGIDERQLRAALEDFRGEIQQIPPMYSAIKINGQRLYDIARRGGEVERKLRTVTISSLQVCGRDGQDYILDVCCSKGTYIRTLCSDIGDKLGCGGCMSGLRRVRCGIFDLSAAHTLDEVKNAADAGRAEKLLLPVDTLFAGYPKLVVDDRQEQKLRVGNILKTTESDGQYRVYAPSGEFLALCSALSGELKTIKSFFEI